MNNLIINCEHKMSLYFMQFIDSYEAHLELRVGHDRHLCQAWRSRYLVDRALAMDNPLSNVKNNRDNTKVRAAAVERVVDEYTVRDKVTSFLIC